MEGEGEASCRDSVLKDERPNGKVARYPQRRPLDWSSAGHLGEGPEAYLPQKQALSIGVIGICLQPFKLVDECQGHFELARVQMFVCSYAFS